MKTKLLLFFFAMAAAGMPGVCHATNPGTSTIRQPINLGTRSDPARIPLGATGVYSNYGYGTHRVIAAARPCPDGPMPWKGGSELDQNLASVFGISVEPEDSTDVTGPPVTLRMKSWKPPEYSPYTREQVLAATLWCLVRSTAATPDHPLDVRVVAESPDDKPLEAKFSGKYFTHPGKDKKPVPPVNIPGTRVEIDARGIPWVVFPDVVAKTETPAADPVFILFRHSGSDEDEHSYHLLPVWGNGGREELPLRLNHWAAPMNHTCYDPTGVREANAFLEEGGTKNFSVTFSDHETAVDIYYPDCTQETLAANILSLVLSTQPTKEKPLKVSIHLEEHAFPRYTAFRGAAGWTEEDESAVHSAARFTSVFEWDPVGKKLAKGSVPMGEISEELNSIDLPRKAE